MTNRVLLGTLPGTFGLRVSKPGFDVLDDTLDGKNVAFDSRWPRAARVWMSGQITLTPVFPVAYQSVGFGTTFAAAPTVLFLWRQTTSSEWQNPTASSGLFEASPLSTYELAFVYADRIDFSRPFTGVNRIVSYIVLRPQ